MGLFVLTTFILISTAQVCLTKKKQKKTGWMLYNAHIECSKSCDSML